MSTTVAPDRILKELAALWVEEGKQGATGVLRACSMTLIVIAEERADTSELGETIAALMPEHPARAILVRVRAGSERALSERVYQQCWMPFGQRRQICCEQIELTASDAALGDLPSVLLPLIVADLPVIVWCRSPRLVPMPEFAQIGRLADKVILDSAQFERPAEGLGEITRAQQGGLRIADLAWTRLTRYREMLARVFENREYFKGLPGIETVSVACAPGYETAGLYMAAWVRDVLAQAGVSVKARASRGAATLSVELASPDLRVLLKREADRLVVNVGDLSYCTHLAPSTDYLLMREELRIVRRDTLFERTLSTAAQLALSSPGV